MYEWKDELNNQNNTMVDDFDVLTDMMVEIMRSTGYFSNEEIYETRDNVRQLEINDKEYIVSEYGNLRVQITRVA